MAKIIEIKEESRVSLKIKCGSCVHLDKIPFYEKKPCVEHGKLQSSLACRNYQPDYFKLTRLPPDFFATIRPYLKGVDRGQLNILSFIFRNADLLKKKGFEFAQPVAFSLTGKDYLNSYFRGYIIGVSNDGELVHITSDLNKSGKKGSLVSIHESNILTVAEYKKKRVHLIENDKIFEPQKVDPSKNLTTFLKMTKVEFKKHQEKLKYKPETYNPPTLDSVDPSWWNSAATTKVLTSKDLLEPVARKKTSRSSPTINKSGIVRISRK